MLEKTLESPLDSKSVNPKGNQSWIFTGRADAEAEAPVLWPPDAKSQLIGKDPGAGKDWGQEKRATEHETVGWHHWLNGHEFEQTPGDGEGQGSLACCCPWGHKESDTSDWTTTRNLIQYLQNFPHLQTYWDVLLLKVRAFGVYFANEKKKAQRDPRTFQGHLIFWNKMKISTLVIEKPQDSLSAKAEISFCSNFMPQWISLFLFLDLSTNKKYCEGRFLQSVNMIGSLR